MTTTAVRAEGLVKHFGETKALDGVDIGVREGTVLGLLGPNGAGKTTAVRILTTLLAPDAGRAEVLGLDVVTDAARLRTQIGLAGQYAAVDAKLTGRENLEMVGRLYHLPMARARERAEELLDGFELTYAADRPSRTYSGGMRRRLDLAASLVNAPPVLFLDEPTTGLDPRSRIGLWEVIERLVGDGTTVLLTTQYLEEADRLADEISVIDHGKVIAEGTADELKERAGGSVIEVRVADVGDAAQAAATLAHLDHGEGSLDPETGLVTIPASEGVATVAQAARALQDARIGVRDLGLRRPTLDEVFLQLTGRGTGTLASDDEKTDQPTNGRGRGRRRARSAA